MKKDADDFNKKMGQQEKHTLYELAAIVNEKTTVNPDGTIAPKVTGPVIHVSLLQICGVPSVSDQFHSRLIPESGRDECTVGNVARVLDGVLQGRHGPEVERRCAKANGSVASKRWRDVRPTGCAWNPATDGDHGRSERSPIPDPEATGASFRKCFEFMGCSS